jgi:RNA polymerase-binding transcription factor DksA
MTSDQLIRGRLVSERERLAGLRAGIGSDLAEETQNGSRSELSAADQHPADTATEMFDRERDAGIVESLDGELADVEAALERLEAGTYGTCEACGRPIGSERLEALPATRYCVEHAGPPSG